MLSEVVADQPSIAKLRYVSIVVPVYNQEKQVSKALERIRMVLDQAFVDYEIVVVDDGSNDGTFEVLQEERQLHPKLKVISYKPNRGKGFAVKTGVLKSKGSIVLFTDGDLDISPDSIKEYIAQLATYDLVIASKRHPESEVEAPLSRVFLSKVFNLLVRLLTDIKLKDTQAGMKSGKGDIMRKIFSTMLIERYAFDVELLTIATMMNIRIKEMPIEIKLDRRFKLRHIAYMFYDLIRLFYRAKVIHWYQKQLKLDVLR